MQKIKKIILIRHGDNLYDSLIANNDLPLSDNGINQSIKAAQLINDDFDVVYCSNSLRTKQTALIINKNHKPEKIDDRLIERGWFKDFNGTETDDMAFNRIKFFFNSISEDLENKKVLIVSHGSLIKLIQNYLEEKVLERDRVYNCTTIIYENNTKKIFNVDMI